MNLGSCYSNLVSDSDPINVTLFRYILVENLLLGREGKRPAKTSPWVGWLPVILTSTEMSGLKSVWCVRCRKRILLWSGIQGLIHQCTNLCTLEGKRMSGERG